ncbi:hypothetical protein EJ04DRAFT_515012 [Polyplosphaeria fusca]|uniref:Uncharacterized protein n=1 Tax=Polyplosphaeria fusca TaxID=682080 RepID=A0A9P4UZA4_9PLEO|nr:hypothetical protein EJ04DRAFT_515012 [Polyplosphaeria fusca]
MHPPSIFILAILALSRFDADFDHRRVGRPSRRDGYDGYPAHRDPAPRSTNYGQRMPDGDIGTADFERAAREYMTTSMRKNTEGLLPLPQEDQAHYDQVHTGPRESSYGNKDEPRTDSKHGMRPL